MADPDLTLSLSDLRRRLGRSQAEVAHAIGTTQSGVSRLERQPDMRLSTLDEYISAVGGRLRLVVDHPALTAQLVVPTLRQHDVPGAGQRREYRVIWQHPGSRALIQVGWLVFTGTEFVFSYTDGVEEVTTFEPFPPFPSVRETYRSPELFPFFAVRLTSAVDPGFDAVIDALGLSRTEATPAELLARSPSSRYDTIQIVPEPTELPTGELVRTFLVSGVRHAVEIDPEHVKHVIGGFTKGTALELAPEPSNEFNPQALQLASNGTVIGWVPDYLVEEIQAYRERGRALTFTVDRANGPEVSWHLRLVCRLTVSAPHPTVPKP